MYIYIQETNDKIESMPWTNKDSDSCFLFSQLASTTHFTSYTICVGEIAVERVEGREKRKTLNNIIIIFFLQQLETSLLLQLYLPSFLATQLLFICAVFFSQSGWGMAWCSRYRVCKNVNKQKKFQLSSIPLPHYKINISTFQVRRGLAVLLFEISFLLF